MNMKKFRKKFPILVYHHIVPDDFSVESFAPGDQPYYSRLNEFYSHLDYLAYNNFLTLTIDDIGNLKKNRQTPKKVAITFDDGQISDYTIVFPAMIERKMKATFYIITDVVGKKGSVTWKQVKEMHNYGMQIGSHGCSHRNLLNLNKDEIETELIKSRQILEDVLGCPVRSFSIPFGFGDKRLVELAIEAGYQTICTSEVKISRFNTDKPVFGRIGLRRGDRGEKFKGIVEMKWQTIGKLILEDRVKFALKRFLGQGLWYKFRGCILQQRAS